MPPEVETIELQDKRTNQNIGPEEVQDYSRPESRTSDYISLLLNCLLYFGWNYTHGMPKDTEGRKETGPWIYIVINEFLISLLTNANGMTGEHDKNIRMELRVAVKCLGPIILLSIAIVLV